MSGDQPKFSYSPDAFTELVEVRDMGPKTAELFRHLTSRVIGQDRIAKRIAQGFTVYNAGLKDPRKPIYAGLLAGPTGTGKTMTSEELSRYVVADLVHAPLTRIACTKLKQSHEVTTLTGSPPSYVGADIPALLNQQKIDEPHFWSIINKLKDDGTIDKSMVDDNPDKTAAELYHKYGPYKSVVLFDEVEKAHPDIWNILLNIVDDGELRMNDGSITSFANSVILLTCNVGGRDQQDRIKKGKLGFSGSFSDEKTVRAQTDQELYELTKKRIEETFPPEFIGRIRDQLLVFRPLNREDVRRAVENRYKEIRGRVSGLDPKQILLTLQFSEGFSEFLIDEGYDRQYGMRPLNQSVKRLIVQPLAAAIEAEDLKTNDEVLFDVKGLGADRETVIRRKPRIHAVSTGLIKLS